MVKLCSGPCFASELSAGWIGAGRKEQQRLGGHQSNRNPSAQGRVDSRDVTKEKHGI